MCVGSQLDARQSSTWACTLAAMSNLVVLFMFLIVSSLFCSEAVALALLDIGRCQVPKKTGKTHLLLLTVAQWPFGAPEGKTLWLGSCSA